MPNLTIQLEPTTDNVITVNGRQTSPGVLFSCVVHIIEGKPQPGDLYVEAGTYTGQPLEQNVIGELLSEYAYVGHRPTWFGQQPIEGNEGIFLFARSSVSCVIALRAKLLRFPSP